ncbi:hypothetical protein BO86DRAFT_398244 [Aspergillus japonicus CBS 114.51]|uniref:Uncharacterized protein n=1 Tax=Aspergillus japonicus CBS 114.51 TaxID=1448312 RepID=A0A8T8X4Y1_ASPJA|nr:hypothetical protein BO86DRAFT_398244 [Aspergillus japonicus CBS 114.51]RAH83208.1 hypothetical protein BO86DRAFT_398244 [Aspergillus japonicus CBS 114.51]
MKFHTALIIISGLAAGVLAAPIQSPARGSLDATERPRPEHEHSTSHNAVSNALPASYGSAPALHVPLPVPLPPEQGAAAPSEHPPPRERRQLISGSIPLPEISFPEIPGVTG